MNSEMKKKDIFISHSYEDTDSAVLLCSALESDGYKCWIAPRDNVPGMSSQKNASLAMEECLLVVLMYSKSSQDSKYVKSELTYAFHSDIPVIPVRLENVIPEREMEFFLSTFNWIEAFEKSFEEYFPQIISVVKQIWDVEKRKQKDIQPPAPETPTFSVGSQPGGPEGSPGKLDEEKSKQKTAPFYESAKGEPPSRLLPQEQEEGITFLFKRLEASQREGREYKHIMYTEQDVKEDIKTTMKCGRKLTEEWYSELQNFYPRLAEQILYIFDFASEIFYFNGKQLPTSTDPKAEYNYYKALFIILLSPKGTQITFEDLYRIVTGVYDEEKARITTQHWFTVLKNRLGVKKKDLNRLFKSWKREGYKVEKEEESKFLLILETGMVQKIMKFSKS